MTVTRQTSQDSAKSSREVSDFLSSDAIMRLFEYWRSKRNGRSMPARRDIDPLEIPWALSKIFLIDFEPPETFRYRLAGEEISDVFGKNLKGCTLQDILSPEGCERVTERWMNLVETRSIIAMKGLVYLPADRIPLGERILLPLAEIPGGPVTGLVGMTECEWISGPMTEEYKLADIELYPVAGLP
jgi:hypothetical protein